jgi:hypothetical protein
MRKQSIVAVALLLLACGAAAEQPQSQQGQQGQTTQTAAASGIVVDASGTLEQWTSVDSFVQEVEVWLEHMKQSVLAAKQQRQENKSQENKSQEKPAISNDNKSTGQVQQKQSDIEKSQDEKQQKQGDGEHTTKETLNATESTTG